MSSKAFDFEQDLLIEESELQAIAQDVLDTMKLAALKGIGYMIDPTAYPLPNHTDTVEHQTIAYFRQRPEDKQELIKKNATQLLEQFQLVAKNVTSPLQQVDLTRPISVLEQTTVSSITRSIRRENPHSIASARETFQGQSRGDFIMIELPKEKGPLQGSTLITDIFKRPPLEPNNPEAAIQQKYKECSAILGKLIGSPCQCRDGKGWYQCCEYGAIYWSSEFGAQEVHGAIYKTWKSLGLTSQFGYPTTDEQSTSDGIGRYNHFQQGSIYWNPATGAYGVYGDFWKKWAEKGLERSELGYPTMNAMPCFDGLGAYQRFQNGAIYSSPNSGVHEVHGEIYTKWESLGVVTGFGYPLTDQRYAANGLGQCSHFQHGSIYWHPETGAREVHGEIRNKWAFLGWERSYLGFPRTDESPAKDAIGRYNHFQGGTIYWAPGVGAYAMDRKIQREWEQQGGELCYLGYPLSDTTTSYITNEEPLTVSTFQGGAIRYDKHSSPRAWIDFTKLRLCLCRVKCLDETNPENFLSEDEIHMGGVAASLNNELTSQISQFKVGDFEDGDQFTYSSPKELCTFNLKEIPGWPKHFIVTLALAEVDSGGFGEFLTTIFKMIRSKVEQEVRNAVTKTTGSVAGAVTGGTLGGMIGGFIGAAAGWALGKFFDWLCGIANDDAFPLRFANISLPSVFPNWQSIHQYSPEETFLVQGHGGEYQYWVRWELT